ncbi:hypothetical protein PoB_001942000 [Plakobranchus ocellatus]|uniref:Uncharacterized protein n=1 Tax=Plakobranchus ocellatus TaxID=259542 RepID=A0AAV3ZBK8_9GAST|nr:hypothetical protein PoB_001942000 [Plakobranchus ocellatus]
MQRPSNFHLKQKARGTSWAVIKESTVLTYSSDKKAGHAPHFRFLAPSSLSGGIPDWSFAAQSAAAN